MLSVVGGAACGCTGALVAAEAAAIGAIVAVCAVGLGVGGRDGRGVGGDVSAITTGSVDGRGTDSGLGGGVLRGVVVGFGLSNGSSKNGGTEGNRVSSWLPLEGGKRRFFRFGSKDVFESWPTGCLRR